ncbi:hypothetical protein BX265_7003 [Streptomyces sp. TLI_235]|nr:hypothetical protein BX265_7003 [Streptomyces sp. TLI_235]
MNVLYSALPEFLGGVATALTLGVAHLLLRSAKRRKTTAQASDAPPGPRTMTQAPAVPVPSPPRPSRAADPDDSVPIRHQVDRCPQQRASGGDP